MTQRGASAQAPDPAQGPDPAPAPDSAQSPDAAPEQVGATALAELAAALGEALVRDPAALDLARADKSGHRASAAPLALVEARSIDDVSATLRIANAHGIPVVPRGGGSGLAGGAIAGEGELVLSLRGMDRILEIDPVEQLAVVEAGVVNADLDAAARAQGLFFAPDPASRALATVGGNVATNAGGLACVAYGVTREAVLGLTVVLADGTVLETGRRTAKGVTGLDLTALMVGSEGTLGVVVRATVRLRRVPEGDPATVRAAFDGVGAAARAATAILAAGVAPAALELLDAGSLEAIVELLGPVDAAGLEGAGALLLVRTDGPDAAVRAEFAARVCADAGASVEVAADPAEGERLFAARRAFHPALEARGTVLIEDVAVPRSRLPEMFAALERIARETGIPIPTVAHAGDGNLHPNFVLPAPEPGAGDAGGDAAEVPAEVWAAADAVFRAALELGGTLTGEHGVGTLKRRWLADELGDDAVALQRRIKAAFDPNGILNPGKAI
ncbi:MAG: FAD-binding protein [Actinomycetales bacterium]|nr:FAD-binding protein [Actinomycetales bacterium]